MDERVYTIDREIDKLQEQLAHAKHVRSEYDEADPKAPYTVPIRTSARIAEAQYDTVRPATGSRPWPKTLHETLRDQPGARPPAPYGDQCSTAGNRISLGNQSNAILSPPPAPTIAQRLNTLRDVRANLAQLIEGFEQRLDGILTPLDHDRTAPSTENGPGGYRLLADEIGALTYDFERLAQRLLNVHTRINL